MTESRHRPQPPPFPSERARQLRAERRGSKPTPSGVTPTGAIGSFDSDTTVPRAGSAPVVMLDPPAGAVPDSAAPDGSFAPVPPRARSESLPSTPGVDARWGGRLKIVDELGRGAMGTVLRAVDTKLRRELALKVSPLPRRQMPRDRLARFVEEAQITAQLEHPNIVPMHDLGVDPEGRAYFSMKLIKGRSLEEILLRKQEGDDKTVAEFGLRRLLDVFLQVCQAIEYAHARGVVHRDLKPANIMVGDFGEVLVMDWGVAKLLERSEAAATDAVSTSADEAAGELSADSDPPAVSMPEVTSVRGMTKAWETQHGTVIGTPCYMSPEQAVGQGVDQRSDIYSLGVILYEILCGDVPFEDEDPQTTLRRVITESPRRPSELNPATPLALEALALRMLEKAPEDRTLTISQIRAHVHNYIEGIGRDYRRESMWSGLLWGVGGLVMFAFLVWYLTGRSIATVLAIGPPAVLNAVGWFMFVLALGYPLWAVYLAVRQNRQDPDRFRPPNRRELFISGHLAHRSFAVAMAPLFQLVFIVELVTLAVLQASRGAMGSDALVQQVSAQMRTEWSQALIVIIVFQFAYLFSLATEVRFARRIDRYELLVTRPQWESVWPFFLIVVLLATLATTDVLHWFLATPDATFMAFLAEQVLAPRLDVFEIVKTLVFQGTFLLGLAVITTLVAFPFAEVLASLRVAYQPADEAAIRTHVHYFTRSLAVFRVGRMVWLYGGAMIASLTALTILSEAERPLVEKVLYILGPSLIGFSGYLVFSRYVRGYLRSTPALGAALGRRQDEAKLAQREAALEELTQAPLSWRLLQLTVPVLCIVGYLVWTGSGIEQEALTGLILPVTTKGWLLITPYALLLPVLLLRDNVQRWWLRRSLDAAARPAEA